MSLKLKPQINISACRSINLLYVVDRTSTSDEHGSFLLLNYCYNDAWSISLINSEGREHRSWKTVFWRWDRWHIPWGLDSWGIHRGMESAAWASGSRCLTASIRTWLGLSMNSTPTDCMSQLPPLQAGRLRPPPSYYSWRIQVQLPQTSYLTTSSWLVDRDRDRER